MAGGAGGALILDETTGLPSAVEFPPSTNLAPIVCTTSLVLRVGGDEVRALAGGLDYPGAEEVSGFSVAAADVTRPGGGAEAWRVRTELSGWSLLLDYRVGGESAPSSAGI